MVSPGEGSAGSTRLRRALFVDRDGTLNPDLHYLREPDRLELFRGVRDAVRLVHEHGELVICVTNQSGIERGLYTADDVARVHARLNELLEAAGTRIDAFYFCPHLPERGCACRKPGTALFERAAAEHRVDLAASAMVGDRAVDVEAARRLGLLTAVVETPGHEAEVEAELRARHLTADLTALSFEGAVVRVLARG